MNVPTKPGQEEYVRDMAPRESLAAIQDVPTKPGQEGFVSSTVPRSTTRDAVMKDVPTMLRLEEYVSDMEQMLRLAVTKDVPTTLSREELCKARCKEEKVYLQP